MIPRDSPHVLPLVSIEDLGGVPTELSDLSHRLTCPKTLSLRMEADANTISSLLRWSCEREVVVNPKTYFFVLMLATITRTSEENIVTLGDVCVALPRHPRAHLETLTDWLPKTCTPAAISMILLESSPAEGHLVSVSPTPDSPSTHEAPMVEDKHGTISEETNLEPMDVDFENRAESETSSGEEDPGLHNPALQLRLLARPISSTPFCIPAVILAEYDTIANAMASALQQRRAWGLANMPVLGLAFDPRSTRLQTFWGWFEDQGTGEEFCVHLPRVAFSAAPNHERAPTLFGTYELTDRDSALALAQLIQTLHPHFEDLRRAGSKAVSTGIAHSEPQVWRSDTPITRIDGSTGFDRIKSWLEKAEATDAGDVAPIFPPLDLHTSFP